MIIKKIYYVTIVRLEDQHITFCGGVRGLRSNKFLVNDKGTRISLDFDKQIRGYF